MSVVQSNLLYCQSLPGGLAGGSEYKSFCTVHIAFPNLKALKWSHLLKTREPDCWFFTCFESPSERLELLEKRRNKTKYQWPKNGKDGLTSQRDGRSGCSLGYLDTDFPPRLYLSLPCGGLVGDFCSHSGISLLINCLSSQKYTWRLMASTEKPKTCRWPCRCWAQTVADDVDLSFWTWSAKTKRGSHCTVRGWFLNLLCQQN